MEISARHQKKHHYDVICYHSVSKVVYFVEHDIGYHDQRGGTPPPPVLQRDKKPNAYRVKIVSKLFLCAYIKSCFCPVFTCLKSVKK